MVNKYALEITAALHIKGLGPHLALALLTAITAQLANFGYSGHARFVIKVHTCTTIAALLICFAPFMKRYAVQRRENVGNERIVGKRRRGQQCLLNPEGGVL